MTPALLMVAMEPPASLEEEFQDWYDTEHLPQRRSLPGFRSATRWVCIDGWPRWMALYELDSRAALESDAYREVSGARSTPWSRRLLPRTVGRLRVVADERDPAVATFDDGGIGRLLVASVRLPTGAVAGVIDEMVRVVAVVREALARRGSLLFLRTFVERESDATPTLWLIAAFDTPEQACALADIVGRPAGRPLHTFHLYVPYRRSSY